VPGREGDLDTVMAGLAERIDLLLACAGLDHVMELLMIGVPGNKSCLLLAGN